MEYDELGFRVYTAKELKDFLIRNGYRECDIAACNCGSWHGGHASDRLRELREVIGENGKTLLQSATDLQQQLAQLQENLEILRKENRGTMHGRHEMTLQRMKDLMVKVSPKYSPKPTELAFFEYVDHLQAENKRLDEIGNEQADRAIMAEMKLEEANRQVAQLQQENSKLKSDWVSMHEQLRATTLEAGRKDEALRQAVKELTHGNSNAGTRAEVAAYVEQALSQQTPPLYSAVVELVGAMTKFFSWERGQTTMGYVGKNPNFYKVNVDAYDELERSFATLKKLMGSQQ